MNIKKFLILILSSFVLYGFQPKLDYPVILLLQEKSRGCDVIFTSAYKPYFPNTLKHSLITPLLKQIQKAEKILISQYNEANTKHYINTSYKYKPVKDVKDHLKYFKRQYYSYVDKNNDTIVVIQLLNFKRKKWAEKYFENWDKEVFFQIVERIKVRKLSSEVIWETLEVNLSKNQLKVKDELLRERFIDRLLNRPRIFFHSIFHRYSYSNTFSSHRY